MRPVLSYSLLLCVKAVSRAFYRHELTWVETPEPDPWEGLRVVALLNHTSLYEPLFTACVPNRFLRQVARHGVVPAAAKTMHRPLIGPFFRLVARHVVPVTRERDETWKRFLERASEDRALAVILPEGRMMRRDGLDAEGGPMTVRGGIADLLRAAPGGGLLLAYSGGLHHVQAPGELLPRPFRRLRIRAERLEVADYRERILAEAGEEGFKEAVKRDLERRRDLYCPLVRPASSPA